MKINSVSSCFYIPFRGEKTSKQNPTLSIVAYKRNEDNDMLSGVPAKFSELQKRKEIWR